MFSLRQLAAIMFTDIVGYTSLMGEDEQNAFKLLIKNRQIQQPLLEKFNGRFIKELGDGILASFHTATDAVFCAIQIQQKCVNVPGLKLRIGIHLGEVVFEDNDVFGDGVNIASRIQAIAPVGGIWVSETVYSNVMNKKFINAIFVGEKLLKNVKDAVRIYEINFANVTQKQLADYTFQNQHQPDYSQKSIAVLPFINLGNDPEQEYFGEGIAEDIINSLTHIRDLKVAGRMSSFQFKSEKANLREIGEKLGVSNVLEGSIRKQGNTVRVIVQLINIKDGFHLWSEKFDRPLNDIFSIQDEIALAITEKLKVTLLANELDKLTQSPTQNSDAYDLYLKGRFYVIRRGTYVLTGLEYFLKAINIDKNFALAYAGCADAYLLLATYGMASPRELMIKAKDNAEKAIAINPMLCEPYCSLAYYYTCYEWNWDAAKKNFIQSLELNQRYNEVHLRYGYNYLCWIEGNFPEAEKHGLAAIKVEPLHSISYGTYSLILHAAGKFEKALQVCKAGIDLDANSFLCRLNEGNIYLAMERFDEAIASYNAALEISNRHHFMITGLISTYCQMNEKEKAMPLMAELEQRASTEYISNTFLGICSARLNNLNNAFEYFEKAYNSREPLLLSIKYEHWIPVNVKEDKRFIDLLKRIGFPQQKDSSIKKIS
jgi:TolB-like protein/class 3 adenylate cyclase/Tfp pilus assembly protein PilF